MLNNSEEVEIVASLPYPPKSFYENLNEDEIKDMQPPSFPSDLNEISVFGLIQKIKLEDKGEIILTERAIEQLQSAKAEILASYRDLLERVELVQDSHEVQQLMKRIESSFRKVFEITSKLRVLQASVTIIEELKRDFTEFEEFLKDFVAPIQSSLVEGQPFRMNTIYDVLLGHLKDFSNELRCFLCSNVFKSPRTATQCGHSYCYDCIQIYLKSGQNECPQCRVPITGKSLARNSSYSTMTQCIAKINGLLQNGRIPEPVHDVADDEEILKNVLGGVIEDSSNDNTQLPMAVDLIVANETKEPGELLQTPRSPIIRNLKMSKSSPHIRVGNINKRIDPRIRDPKTSQIEHVGLVLTGLSDDQRKLISQSLSKLSKMANGIPFTIEKDFSPSAVATHLVCACAAHARCPRTLKYLMGIAEKLWVVSFEWILSSLVAGKLLPEADFVVRGDEAVQCDTHACERSRADSEHELFAGMKFYLAGSFSAAGPSKSDLQNLIKHAGGVVVSSSTGPETIHISNNLLGPKPGELPYTWLFDSLSHYKIQPK